MTDATQAAREWLEQRWPHNELGDVVREDDLAALLAAREAAAYRAGQEDMRERAAKRVRDYVSPHGHNVSAFIRDVETLIATREAALIERCEAAERERADLWERMNLCVAHKVDAESRLTIGEADCAAMRVALENCVHEEKCSNCCQDWPPNTECQGCKGMRLKAAALSSTAGEHVAAVYRAAVAICGDKPNVADFDALHAAVDEAEGRTE